MIIQLAILKQQNAINFFKELAKKFGWKNDWDDVFEDKTFDVLVLTNQEAKIQWGSLELLIFYREKKPTELFQTELKTTVPQGTFYGNFGELEKRSNFI